MNRRYCRQVLPMENERGRQKVETRNLCERKNGRGVDTNRNWPVHWGFKEPDYDSREEYPGDEPFRCLKSSGSDQTVCRNPVVRPVSCCPLFWVLQPLLAPSNQKPRSLQRMPSLRAR